MLAVDIFVAPGTVTAQAGKVRLPHEPVAPNVRRLRASMRAGEGDIFQKVPAGASMPSCAALPCSRTLRTGGCGCVAPRHPTMSCIVGVVVRLAHASRVLAPRSRAPALQTCSLSPPVPPAPAMYAGCVLGGDSCHPSAHARRQWQQCTSMHLILSRRRSYSSLVASLL
jgi:hypothetical protein